jgi:alpha-galactosidase
VSTGLSDAGYKYVILDAGWQAAERDAERRQQIDLVKFPGGIHYLSDKLHKLGLKIGIYRSEAQY